MISGKQISLQSVRNEWKTDKNNYEKSASDVGFFMQFGILIRSDNTELDRND